MNGIFTFGGIKMLKKILLMLLALCILLGAAACGNEPQDVTDAFTTEPETITTTKAPTTTQETTKTKPVTEIGFYNLNDISDNNGNCLLVGITGYSWSDGGYIYLSPNDTGLLFSGGFIQTIYDISPDNNMKLSYKTGRGPYAYTIVSNDGVSFGPDGSVLINKRVNIYNKAVVLKCQTHFASTNESWLVPATMIDWSTQDDDFVAENGYKYTRYFLK